MRRLAGSLRICVKGSHLYIVGVMGPERNMNGLDLFTVIIPTHGRPALLRRALQSLAQQTYRNFQVVIVDDEAAYVPPYESLRKLDGQFTYLIRSGVPGPAESRNAGLCLVKSAYVLFLDDDDTFEPSHLQLLAGHVRKENPEIVFCDFKVCFEDRTKEVPAQLGVEGVSLADVTTDSVYIRNRIPNSCLAYRSDVLSDIRFDSSMTIYEDWDFLMACLRGRRLDYLPIDSVVIHKSPANAPENMRRGNTHDELIVSTMLQLYRKYPGANEVVKQGRRSLLSSSGVTVPLDLS
jgi:glycosyltransferase involved in cell wall biosynthesis